MPLMHDLANSDVSQYAGAYLKKPVESLCFALLLILLLA